MRKDTILLGALHIAHSILYILISTAIYAVLLSNNFFNTQSGFPDKQYVIGAVVGAFLFLFAVSGIIASVGLIKSQPWSQMMILILGCLDLVFIPLGTVLGIYTIYVFIHNEITTRAAPDRITSNLDETGLFTGSQIQVSENNDI